MPFNRYGGRSMARNANAADVHGRVRERAFDLPAEVPPVRLSEHELAQAQFAGLPEDQQDQLLGFLQSHIEPEVPRIGTGRGGLSGCLWSDEIAADASAFLTWAVSIRACNGALLAAGYLPTRKTSSAAVWAVGARKQDS
jgi:hypothetical protein